MGALEERIMMSASPMAVVADAQSVEPAEGVDNADTDGVDAQTAQEVDESQVENFANIVFVDAAVEDYQELIDGIGQESGDTDIVLIDSQSDGIAQITEYLAQHTGIESVHIVSHGSDGEVRLGNTVLNATTLDRYAGQIASWNGSLTSSADILFYGCDLVASDDGQYLIDALSELTGADIAASDDLTGNEDLGGDWDLEYIVGQVETEQVFSVDARDQWQGLLATVSVTTFEDTVNGATSSIEELKADDGGDGISLREAVLAANSSGVDLDTIFLEAGIYELTQGNSLDIFTNIEIIGVSAGDTTIDGLKLGDRVINQAAHSITLRELTITGGNPSDNNGGGGILVRGGSSAVLDRVVVTGNLASTGGGLLSSGGLTVTDSTFSNNVGFLSGGGFQLSGNTSIFDSVTISGNSSAAGGGISSTTGDASFVNTTISGNQSNNIGGGGVRLNGGNLTFNQSTITENEATAASTADGSGGGIFISSGNVELINSIVAGNIASSSREISGAISTSGINIIGDDSGDSDGGRGYSGNDLIDQDDLELAPLADNGGLVQTHELLAGSVGIDGTAVASIGQTDARGYLVADSIRDIGAFERGATPPPSEQAAPASSLWVSTLTSHSDSSAPGLSDWDDVDVIQIGDPNLVLESGDGSAGTTNGTFSEAIDFELFAGTGADTDAIHYVQSSITVGGVELNPGDVLFSGFTFTTYSSENSVGANAGDVYVFQPSTAGDYSSGTFTNVVDVSTLSLPQISGFSLVEADVTVGDASLGRGDFVFLDSTNQIHHYDLSAGTTNVLIDGNDLGIDREIAGVHLVTAETTIGGQVIDAGRLIVSLDRDDANTFDNSISVTQSDVVALNVTQTGVGTTEATGSILFDGSDLELALENWDALTIAGESQAAPANEAPSFGGTLDGNPTFVEDSGGVQIDADVEIFDVELSVIDDFGGSSLTLERVGGANTEDFFQRDDGSNLEFTGANFSLSGVNKGTYTQNSGTIVFNFDAGVTNAEVNEVMQSLAYINSSDNPPASVDVLWIFNDGNSGDQGSGGAGEATGTTTVDITPVNDAPVIDATTPNPHFVGFTEDDINNSGQTVGSLLAQLVDPDTGENLVTDVDGDDIGIAVVVNNGNGGTWQYSTDSGATWSNVGAVSDANALLLQETDLLRFSPDEQQGTNANLGFRAWDQSDALEAGTFADLRPTGTDSAFSLRTLSAQITVSDVNDAPVVVETGFLLTDVSEDAVDPAGDTVGDILASLSGDGITDVDINPVEGIAVTGVDNTNGVWQYSTNDGTTWLSFGSVSSGSSTLLNTDALVRFVPDADYSGTSGNISFYGWDQTNGLDSGDTGVSLIGELGGTGAYSPSLAVARLQVTAINSAPTIDLDADDSAGTSGINFNTSFESGGPAIRLTDGAVVGDVDGTIQTLTIRISNIKDDAAERLAFFRPDGLNSSYVASTGILRFTAGTLATNADFQQVLNSITYQNTSPTPDLTTREITFVVNDGELDSSVATTFVSFGMDTGDAAAPVEVNNSSDVVDEGATLLITSDQLRYSDQQATSSINYSVTSVPSNGFLALSTDATTPISSFTQEDIDLGNLIYVHNGTETTSDQFTFSVNDGQGNTDSGQFDIVVNPVNDAPVLDNAGQNTLTAIDEDNFTSAGDTVASIIASAGNPDAITDADADAVEGIAIYAADSTNGTWEYLSNDGITWTGFGTPSATAALLLTDETLVRFVPDADFNGDATFSYRAWDQTTGDQGDSISLTNNTGGTGSLSVRLDTARITVNPVNDDPVAVDDVGYTTLEDTPLTILSSELLANDSDIDGDTLGISLVSAPNGTTSFSGFGANSMITYTPNENFVGVETITYTLTDRKGGTDTATIEITVVPVNDAPELTGGMVSNLTVNEDSGFTSLGLAGLTHSPGGGADEGSQTLDLRSHRGSFTGRR